MELPALNVWLGLVYLGVFAVLFVELLQVKTSLLCGVIGCCLAVLPAFRRRGFGGQLMGAMADLARREGRRGVTLTCLDAKVGYYAAFGFHDHGVGGSVHGGVPWHNMVLDL